MLAVQFTSSARIAACVIAMARASARDRFEAFIAGIDVAALATQGPPRWTKESFRRTCGTTL